MTRGAMLLLGPGEPFPPVARADESGLVCVGGGLETARLLAAYRAGLFPWPLFGANAPLLWFSPSPRFVLFPDELHTSRSLRKRIRKHPFRITVNQRFAEVVLACREVERPGQEGTWITPAMVGAYVRLHRLGLAHSVEVIEKKSEGGEERLLGGLYGIALGRVFFGESMFAAQPDASKIAFALLVEALTAAGFELIDCQQETEHLRRFGARSIGRDAFCSRLAACDRAPAADWRAELLRLAAD